MTHEAVAPRPNSPPIPPFSSCETWSVTSPRVAKAAAGTGRSPRAAGAARGSARLWAKAVAAVSGKSSPAKPPRLTAVTRPRSAAGLSEEAGETADRLRAAWRLRESVEAAVWDDGRTPRGDVFPSPFRGRGWRRPRLVARGRTPEPAPRGGVAAVDDSPQRVHGGTGGRAEAPSPPSTHPALLAAAALALAAAHAPALAAALLPASPLAAALTALALALFLASGAPSRVIAAISTTAAAAAATARGLDQVCATVDGLGLLPLLILRVEAELAAVRADIGAMRRKVEWVPNRPAPRVAGSSDDAGD